MSAPEDAPVPPQQSTKSAGEPVSLCCVGIYYKSVGGIFIFINSDKIHSASDEKYLKNIKDMPFFRLDSHGMVLANYLQGPWK
jgi:hypothetical protein